MKDNSHGPILIGVTGASGVVYAQRLVEVLLAKEYEVFLVVSSAARRVIKEELPAPPGQDPWGNVGRQLLRIYPEKDFGAPYCSGTFFLQGMAIVPATMGTIGAVANGFSQNGIHRAADVTLKEGRRLVLVPRETPLSVVHLENLLRLARAGAVVLPPAPAFYQKPKTVDDLVDFVVSRVLDALGVDNELFPRWGTTEEREVMDP